MVIVGYINGQDLQLRHSKIVSDTVDYLTADFFFMTNEWDGFKKYAHFVNGETHYKIEIKNDKIFKTDHLNLTSGTWSVYIHGALNTEIITTNKSELFVEATGDISGGEDAGGAIQEAIKAAQEEYRSDLETSLETARGENYDGKTWEELNETVRDMSLEPFITPMLGFFEEYHIPVETPEEPPEGGGEFPVEPENPNEGGTENVTE